MVTRSQQQCTGAAQLACSHVPLVPHYPARRCSGRVQLRVTALRPLRPLLLDSFESKADLIDACLASVHLPVFLDGRFAARFRGELVAVEPPLGATCRQPGPGCAVLQPAAGSCRPCASGSRQQCYAAGTPACRTLALTLAAAPPCVILQACGRWMALSAPGCPVGSPCSGGCPAGQRAAATAPAAAQLPQSCRIAAGAARWQHWMAARTACTARCRRRCSRALLCWTTWRTPGLGTRWGPASAL